MNKLLGALSVLAIVVTAACNRSEAPPANDIAAEITANAADRIAAAGNAAESIRARQTHYKQFGAAMKGINDELKSGTPSPQAIQAHAERLRAYAPQIAGWFPAGSGSEAGLRTRAKQEIWSDPEGFRRAAQAFVAATQEFHRVAQTGDMAAIRAGVRDLGASCKGCHDRFRAPEE